MSATFVEIMNVKVAAGSRTLYVDLKENADGTRFLSISEVHTSRGGERSRILLDEEYVPELYRAIGAAVERLSRKTSVKSYSVQEKRRDHPRAYAAWTSQEDEQLKERYEQGTGVTELAEQHGRAPTAVLSRLYQLGVIKHKEKPRWD